jgi:hypothetical protein
MRKKNYLWVFELILGGLVWNLLEISGLFKTGYSIEFINYFLSKYYLYIREKIENLLIEYLSLDIKAQPKLKTENEQFIEK